MLPEDFETQFQGNPIAGAGLVSEDAWKYYEELPALFYAAIIVDTGVERSETNDPTNAIAVGYGATGAYVLDAVEGKWSIDEMEEEILALLQRIARRMGARQPAEYPYMVPLVIIEKASLGRPLHDALIKRLPPFMVKMCSTEGQSKLIRARAQAHHIQRGKVFLPKHSGFTREIIRQWFAFPRGVHDEYVDTLSYALRHADNIRIAREYIERMFGAFNPAQVNALDNGSFDTDQELLEFERATQLWDLLPDGSWWPRDF
jgi:predicted phage terminase large subunit-like protein